ncbi:unnamed protein product [Phyllotreta striolata]|uniref:Uncharacterized protein n=1 Tax=Phyllotreta striolata TaxID=444603 RepID=A0A9N9XN42_PHYSR|nr:unnamed protein product [Phyllotreta striolata]
MKFSIVSALVIGVSLAQPQRRPHSFFDDQKDIQKQQDYQSDRQYQKNSIQDNPTQNQYQDQRPHQRHETTTYIPIIRFDKEQSEDGSYKAAYETGNNIIAEEEGYLKNLGPDPNAEGETLKSQVQTGSFTYTSPEGILISVKYVADESGFHATGDHLPTPPPVSPEVQKGLELIYAGIRAQEEEDARRQKENPQEARRKPEYDDGQYRQY